MTSPRPLVGMLACSNKVIFGCISLTHAVIRRFYTGTTTTPTTITQNSASITSVCHVDVRYNGDTMTGSTVITTPVKSDWNFTRSTVDCADDLMRLRSASRLNQLVPNCVKTPTVLLATPRTLSSCRHAQQHQLTTVRCQLFHLTTRRNAPSRDRQQRPQLHKRPPPSSAVTASLHRQLTESAVQGETHATLTHKPYQLELAHKFTDQSNCSLPPSLASLRLRRASSPLGLLLSSF